MVGAEEKRCCSTDHHHHHHRQQDNIDLLLLLLLLASIPRRWSIREISFSLTQWLRRLFLNKSSGGLDMIIIIEDLRYFTKFYWFSILLGIKFQAIYLCPVYLSLSIYLTALLRKFNESNSIMNDFILDKSFHGKGTRGGWVGEVKEGLLVHTFPVIDWIAVIISSNHRHLFQLYGWSM